MSQAPPSRLSLGPFDLEARIGRGGMGDVYRARHRGLGTPAAIKVLTAKTARDPFFVRGFQNEVRAVAGLTHPNIVGVLDHGLVDAQVGSLTGGQLHAGSPYLVMELAEGGSLVSLQGRLSWPELNGVLACLLDALAHAHARGVVHRDIKPGNVLLGGLRPGVKLTDFGLAHAIDTRAEDREEPTGTPAYMPPEQLHGDWRAFGPWTDLYSLGCLAFTLATGGPPFGRDSTQAAYGHLYRAFPRMEARVAVPVGFEEWVRALTQKDPAQRMRRAADALAALFALGPPDDLVLDRGDLLPPSIPPPGDPTTVVRLPRQAAGPAPGVSTGASAPRPRAPLPADWRPRHHKQAAPPVHVGAGLGLFGLREVPLMGREPEQDVLWGALRQVHTEGTARAVLLSGSTGVGKSRLAQWLGRRAHEVGAARVLRARHGPNAGPGTGLGPMLAGSMRAQGLTGEALASRIRGALGAGAALGEPELRALGALLGGADHESKVIASPVERQVLVQRTLGRLARERPLVVILDDVQWGLDALGLAQRVLSSTAPVPILLVLTVRSDDLADRPVAQTWLERAMASAAATALSLGPLPAEAMANLVAHLLQLTPELAAQVAAQSSGSPEFAVQLVREWVGRGVLEPTTEGLRLAGGAVVSMPDGLHGIWTQRLERLLAAEAKTAGRALELAAVLGPEVRLDEWRDACNLLGLPAALALLDRLAGEGLLQLRGAPQVDTARFVDGLFRESLLRKARDSGDLPLLLRTAAEVVRRQGGPMADERAGWMLVAGGRPGAALGPLLRAAQSRLDKAEFVAAERLLGERERVMAETRVPDDDPRRGQGEVLMAAAAMRRGRLGEAATRAEDVVARARRYGWPAVLGRGLRTLSKVAVEHGDLDRAARCLDEAEHWATHAEDPELEVDVWRGLVEVAARRGRVQEARGHAQRALDMSRQLGDPGRTAVCLLALAYVARQAGEAQAGIAHAQQARVLYEQSGARWGLASAVNALGELHRLAGDLDQAILDYQEAQALHEEVGSGRGAIAQVNMGIVLCQIGDWAQARAALQEASGVLASAGRSGLDPFVQVGLMTCAAGLADWTECADRLGAAVRGIADTGLTDVDFVGLAQQATGLCRAAGQEALAARLAAFGQAQAQALSRAGAKPSQ